MGSVHTFYLVLREPDSPSRGRVACLDEAEGELGQLFETALDGPVAQLVRAHA